MSRAPSLLFRFFKVIPWHSIYGVRGAPRGARAPGHVLFEPAIENFGFPLSDLVLES